MLQVLFKVVSCKAHLVTVCFKGYPTFATLEAYGAECIQESFVFRIEQAVRRVCQCIRGCSLFGEARFSEGEEPKFFFISHGGLSLICHCADGTSKCIMGFTLRYRALWHRASHPLNAKLGLLPSLP